MIDVIAALWSWDPGFRGLLTVAVAVTILCGSVFLILATNNGARLGFMLALTGFCGWMFVMGIIWSLYGIGYKGAAPTWKVVDVVRTEPGSKQVESNLEVATKVPLPKALPDPVETRDGDKALLKAFPQELKDPNLGDLVVESPELQDKVNAAAAPWRILETPNKYTGETQAVVAEALGPDGQNVFENGAADYIVIESFLTGGKQARCQGETVRFDCKFDNTLLGRVQYKAWSVVNQRPPELYAAVQLQQVIPQETKPGQAPPAPIADKTQPVITVILKRVDGHLLRRHALAMTFLMGVTTAALCWMLHARDKRAIAQRAAVAGAS